MNSSSAVTSENLTAFVSRAGQRDEQRVGHESPSAGIPHPREIDYLAP
jgi:hypothetical protein